MQYIHRYKQKNRYRKIQKESINAGLDKIKTFEEGENFSCDHKKHLNVKRRLVQSDAVYAAMIYNLDYNIGRVLDALQNTGQVDNTVIFFTSDNGGLATAEGSPTCNAPLSEGKGWMYEGGVREPLIVKWPGVIDMGSICNAPVTSPDFYSTILEMTGLSLLPEQHQDGESIMPLLTQKGKLEREAICWHYSHYGNQGGTQGSSVRMGDFKLIEFFEDRRLELYNLKKDIKEEYNLKEELPDIADRIQKMLNEWRKSVGALIPEVNPDYQE